MKAAKFSLGTFKTTTEELFSPRTFKTTAVESLFSLGTFKTTAKTTTEESLR